jgi:hypothetical protein
LKNLFCPFNFWFVSVTSVSSVANSISVFFDHGVADKQPFFRPLQPQDAKGTKFNALGVPETKVAFDCPVILGIKPRPGGSEIPLTSLYAFLAADACPLVDNPGICSLLPVYLQSSHRTSLEAGGICTLMAYLGLVISMQIIFFQKNPGERVGITAPAVEIGADHLTNAAPGAKGFVRQDHSFSQSHFSPVGESDDLQQASQANNTAEGKSAKSETFENRSPVDILRHLPFAFQLELLYILLNTIRVQGVEGPRRNKLGDAECGKY